MNRDSSIKSIRPKIETSIEIPEEQKIEYFQNNTLRPILKFQHDILSLSFKDHAFRKKVDLSELRIDQLRNFIEFSFQKDQKFRQYTIGLIVGFFTETELIFYHSNKKELNKRLINMLIIRLIDALGGTEKKFSF